VRKAQSRLEASITHLTVVYAMIYRTLLSLLRGSTFSAADRTGSWLACMNDVIFLTLDWVIVR
jgi:hypothetical protein